jgi:hypothetical protein
VLGGIDAARVLHTDLGARSRRFRMLQGLKVRGQTGYAPCRRSKVKCNCSTSAIVRRTSSESADDPHRVLFRMIVESIWVMQSWCFATGLRFQPAVKQGSYSTDPEPILGRLTTHVLLPSHNFALTSLPLSSPRWMEVPGGVIDDQQAEHGKVCLKLPFY